MSISTATGAADESCSAYFAKYDQTEETYLTSRDELREMLKAVSTNTSTPKSLSRNDQGQATTPFSLPALKIPTFSGDIKAWAPFRYLFRRLIHDNETLTDIHRLHYLKNNVSGDAERQIRHIELTDANYATAWTALANRYARISIKAHLTSLLNIGSVKNESSVEIKRLLDETIENINALRNLGRDVWDDIVVHLTVGKLDINTQQHWERHLGNTKQMPTFKQLETFLEMSIQILMPNELSPPKTFRPPPKSSTFSSSGSNFKPNVIHHQSHHINIQPTCCLCDSSHMLSSCPAFKRLNVSSRHHFVANAKLCTNCLRIEHVVNKCTSKYNCRQCKQRHHSLLHQDNNSAIHENNHNNNNNIQHSNAVSSQNSSYNLSTTPYSPVTSCTTSISPNTPYKSSYHVTQPTQQSINSDQPTLSSLSMHNSILLATAWLTVTAPNGKITSCRALLDQGSKVSFISEKIVQLLQLPKTKTNLQIMGINNNSLGSSRNIAQFTI